MIKPDLEPTRGHAWERKPNATFGVLSALRLMLHEGISDLAAIREWLDAERLFRR